MLDWLADNRLLLTLLTVGSVVMFLASLALGPMIAAAIPPDYFTHRRRPPSRFAGHHPALRLALLIAKNALGVVLILAGLAMLALPGQGLLTIFVGFVLIDFPGKYALERWLVRRRFVRRPINWIRRRRGRPELQLAARPGPDAGDVSSGA